MNTISTSLTKIENQLDAYNTRLTLIETCLSNMFNFSASTPDSSFSALSTVLPTDAFCTQANTSYPPEEVVISPHDLQTPSPSHRRTTTTTTSVSPLVFNLPTETARKVKKIEARDRSQYLRGCMDVMFTPNEMAVSNIGGKRNKEKLGEAQVHLVKRKLIKLLTLFD